MYQVHTYSSTARFSFISPQGGPQYVKAAYARYCCSQSCSAAAPAAAWASRWYWLYRCCCGGCALHEGFGLTKRAVRHADDALRDRWAARTIYPSTRLPLGRSMPALSAKCWEVLSICVFTVVGHVVSIYSGGPRVLQCEVVAVRVYFAVSSLRIVDQLELHPTVRHPSIAPKCLLPGPRTRALQGLHSASMSNSPASWARPDESYAHDVLEGSEWSNADGAAGADAAAVDENKYHDKNTHAADYECKPPETRIFHGYASIPAGSRCGEHGHCVLVAPGRKSLERVRETYATVWLYFLVQIDKARDAHNSLLLIYVALLDFLHM